MDKLLKFIPEYRDYVWGGRRLRPGDLITAESWVIYEQDLIAEGTYTGRTLAEATADLGEDILGARGGVQSGGRFPLLIKLLDANKWLSMQVHPNDEQAVQLEGSGHFGKTEAWHFLEVESTSGTGSTMSGQIIAGLRAGVSRKTLSSAMREGSILDYAQFVSVNTGDTVLMRAGTVHALGPGLLLYEVQQTSDLTYRVFDWNRSQTASRQLHIEQSLAVIDPQARSQAIPAPPLADGDCQELTTCEYFTLELLGAETQALALDTRGQSFHALTLTEGRAEITCDEEKLTLERFDSLLVPAASGAYQLKPLEPFRALRARV